MPECWHPIRDFFYCLRRGHANRPADALQERSHLFRLRGDIIIDNARFCANMRLFLIFKHIAAIRTFPHSAHAPFYIDSIPLQFHVPTFPDRFESSVPNLNISVQLSLTDPFSSPLVKFIENTDCAKEE